MQSAIGLSPEGSPFTSPSQNLHLEDYFNAGDVAFWDVAPDSLVDPLMMEAVSCFETSVNSYQAARRSIPEDSHFHTHHRENLGYQNCNAVLPLSWFNKCFSKIFSFFQLQCCVLSFATL
jgi:hypothetical protein